MNDQSKSIWSREYKLEHLKKFGDTQNMPNFLGIEYTEIGPDYLVGTMPVNEKTIQPFGLLHGGASCVLAETLASIAGALTCEFPQESYVGMQLSANYLRPAFNGSFVKGIAKIDYKGKKSQVWDVKLYDGESEKLTSVFRIVLSKIKNSSISKK